jgi:hypothetical protein
LGTAAIVSAIVNTSYVAILWLANMTNRLLFVSESHEMPARRQLFERTAL